MEFLTTLLNIATQFRALQMTYHHCHNVVSGDNFFSDHSALGDFYGDAESAYDSVIERLIGMYGSDKLEARSIAILATHKIPVMKDVDWSKLLELEEGIQTSLNEACAKSPNEGTRQLLGDLADKGQVRIYKLKQRLK